MTEYLTLLAGKDKLYTCLVMGKFTSVLFDAGIIFLHSDLIEFSCAKISRDLHVLTKILGHICISFFSDVFCDFICETTSIFGLNGNSTNWKHIFQTLCKCCHFMDYKLQFCSNVMLCREFYFQINHYVAHLNVSLSK